MPTFTAQAKQLLMRLEACRLVAYKDDAGIYTVGWGHTGPDADHDTVWTQERADSQLDTDIHRYSVGVAHALDGEAESLTDPQFSAIVVFTFNVGVEAFIGSTLRRVLIAGHLDEVPNQIMRWVFIHAPSGHLVTDPGLLKRRQAEVHLWQTGAAVA